jgi:hypothetical protein
VANRRPPGPERSYDRDRRTDSVGLTQKLEVKAISLELLPSRDGPIPRAIAPITTRMTAAWGARASFTPVRRRFNLRVTLGDGSVHTIHIHPALPRSQQPQPYKVEPYKHTAPHPGRWTHRDGTSGPFYSAAAPNLS